MFIAASNTRIHKLPGNSTHPLQPANVFVFKTYEECLAPVLGCILFKGYQGEKF